MIPIRMAVAIIRVGVIRPRGKTQPFDQSICDRITFHIFYNSFHCCCSTSSRSPSDGRARIWSSELAKHLQFDLVDTAGMTEDQLREIPYTVVETQMSKARSAATNSLKVHKTNARDRVDRIRGLVSDI